MSRRDAGWWQSVCAKFATVWHQSDELLMTFNLVLQVLKEKKPLTDWSNITGSTPCMMSLSPLTVHKPPQVRSVSPWIQPAYNKAHQFKWSVNLPFFLKGNRCEHLKCLVLSDQQAKTQRFSVYYDRFWRKQADVQDIKAGGCEDLKEKFTHKLKVSLLTTMQMENWVKLLIPL